MADALMIGIRFALFADLMLITGLAAFPLHALRPSERRNPCLVAAFVAPQPWLCWIGLLASLGGIFALTAAMQGIAITEVAPAMLASTLTETDAGKAWIARTLALGVALAAAGRFRQRPLAAAWTVSLAGTAALATLIWSGHAAAGEGLSGSIHRIADALHMVAAAVWIGAIAAFLILLRPGQDAMRAVRVDLAARALDGFARVGTICVLVIAATGLINTQMIVGIANIGASAGAAYGLLLAAKLLLFTLMLALAAVNRWRLTPALATDGEEASVTAIRRSLALEAAAAATILALVALLGTLAP